MGVFERLFMVDLLRVFLPGGALAGWHCFVHFGAAVAIRYIEELQLRSIKH